MRGRRKNVLPFNFLKVFSIVLLVVMLATGLAGCGSNDSGKEHETPTSELAPTHSPTVFPEQGNQLPEMVSIPGGSFQMGDLSGGGLSRERPVHTVTLSPFEMAKFEVTYAKWTEVKDWAESHGYSFNMPGDMGSEVYGGTEYENHPVTNIKWYDAVLWCNALSEMEGRTPCYYTSAAQSTVYRSGKIDIQNSWVKWDANGYRLPTEAEWEYACRARTTTEYSFGYGIDGNYANYRSSGDSYDNGTTPVGYYSPNDWGLYDMHGNVWEWCWDWWGSYTSSGQTDPRGPSADSIRVHRGGCWNDNVTERLRSAFRSDGNPDSSLSTVGFRPVCSQ